MSRKTCIFLAVICVLLVCFPVRLLFNQYQFKEMLAKLERHYAQGAINYDEYDIIQSQRRLTDLVEKFKHNQSPFDLHRLEKMSAKITSNPLPPFSSWALFEINRSTIEWINHRLENKVITANDAIRLLGLLDKNEQLLRSQKSITFGNYLSLLSNGLPKNFDALDHDPSSAPLSTALVSSLLRTKKKDEVVVLFDRYIQYSNIIDSGLSAPRGLHAGSLSYIDFFENDMEYILASLDLILQTKKKLYAMEKVRSE